MYTPYKMMGSTLYGKPLTKKKSDPCWDKYEMVGMKDKGGKKVPNCVPMKKKATPCPGCSTICPSCKSGYPKTMAKKKGCGYKR